MSGLDFSLELTGFEMAEIDLRIASLDDLPEPDSNPADALPELPAGPPLSKQGNVWLLGRHRVLCGNALDPEACRALMGDERAAIVFTDTPYNVAIDGHAGGLGAIHHRPFPMASGEMDRPEFTAFLGQAFRNLATFSVEGSLHYICMDWRHMEELLAAGRSVYSELISLCIWTKDNAGMGSLYRSQHELVFVFKRGRHGHRNNIQLGRFGRNRSNVWRYPGANSFARCGEEGNLLALHPTVKPVTLVADAILDCSARGDIVLDAFLGSGTTVIAAERTGRRCYGLEPRFQKGRSGNPNGRPRGRKNMSTLLSDALNGSVIVVENGRRKKITKREAIVTQLVNKSAAADLKATQIVLAMLRDVESQADGSADPAPFTEADQQIIRRIQARLRGENG